MLTTKDIRSTLAMTGRRYRTRQLPGTTMPGLSALDSNSSSVFLADNLLSVNIISNLVVR